MSDEFDEKLADELKHFSIVGVEIGHFCISYGEGDYALCACVCTRQQHPATLVTSLEKILGKFRGA